jgi:hypothetical protein
MNTSRQSGLTPAGWWAIVIFAVLCLLALNNLGCVMSTVTPDRIEVPLASYDGAEANSGILALEAGGAIVTEKFAARYVALLKLYREAFVPRVNPKDGVAVRPDGTRFITNEVLERMILMSEWRRMGRITD